jgi:hypothetical protein
MGKVKPTKEVKCRCGKNSIVELIPAEGYVRVTPFMCDCGRTFLISDYVNAMTTYGEVEHKQYDEFLEMQKKDATRKKVRDTSDEGRRKYQLVDKWLNSLSIDAISRIEAQRVFTQTIDKEFVIETILEHCRYEDDLLERLYGQYLACNAISMMTTDKREWFILKMVGCVEPVLVGPISTEIEMKERLEKYADDPKESQNSHTYFSAKKDADIRF